MIFGTLFPSNHPATGNFTVNGTEYFERILRQIRFVPCSRAFRYENKRGIRRKKSNIDNWETVPLS